MPYISGRVSSQMYSSNVALPDQEIDVSAWREKLTSFLITNSTFKNTKACVNKERKGDGCHIFYISDITEITPEMYNVIKKNFGGRCELKTRLESIQLYRDQPPLDLMRICIEVKPAVSYFKISNGRLPRMWRIMTTNERYMLALVISVLLITSLLLYFHWKDQSDPLTYMIVDVSQRVKLFFKSPKALSMP